MKPLFTLMLQLHSGDQDRGTTVTIRAYDGGNRPQSRMSDSPLRRLDVRVDVENEVGLSPLFPLGSTWCGLPAYLPTNSMAAHEAVIQLIAVRPGEIEDEHFEDYTADQLAFALAFGEEIRIMADNVYRDERGFLKDLSVDPFEVQDVSQGQDR